MLLRLPRLGLALIVLVTMLGFSAVALANELNQTTPISTSTFKEECKGDENLQPGQVLAHFVHTGTDSSDLPSTLTYQFANAGSSTASGYVNGNSVVMYDVVLNGDDVLLSASDSINNDGNLNLSHICHGPKKPTRTVTELHLDGSDLPVANGSSLRFGSSLHDKATVTGDGTITPTGTVTFTFYTQTNCGGTGSTGTPVGLDAYGVAHPSQSTGALAGGDYGFKATYSGDNVYAGSTSACEPFHIRNNPDDVFDVQKTVTTTFDRICNSSVVKTAKPSTQSLPVGQIGYILWKIGATINCVDSNWVQHVTVVITNKDPAGDTFPVSKLVDQLGGTFTCVPLIPANLGPGESITCTTDISATSGESGTNVATATIDGVSVDSNVAPYSFTKPTNLVDECITITDQQLGLNEYRCRTGGASGSETWYFEGTTTVGPFTAAGCGPHTYTNTATIVTNDTGTTGTSTATSTVNVPCIFNYTMGFYGNVNGIAFVVNHGGYAANAVQLGSGGCGVLVDTQAEAQQIFPNQLNGYALFSSTCKVPKSTNVNSVNTLLGQTLALAYGIKLKTTANGFNGNYADNTIGSLQCTALIPAGSGLSAGSSVTAVLAYFNSLIAGLSSTTTQSQIGAANALGGCLNRES